MEILKRLIGLRYAERNLLRFSWGEMSGNWGLAASLCKFTEHWSLHLNLIYPNVYITLMKPRIEPRDMMESYGFSINFTDQWGASWYLTWGNKSKFIEMPWKWEWHRRSSLCEDGKHWIHELATHKGRETVASPLNDNWFFLKDVSHQWKKNLPYWYKLDSGIIQDRTATISVNEMEWRWKWFMWLSWPCKINRYIEIEFDEEVGERSNSWKGGTLGCSYKLLPDESPEECLDRMQYERRFD